MFGITKPPFLFSVYIIPLNCAKFDILFGTKFFAINYMPWYKKCCCPASMHLIWCHSGFRIPLLPLHASWKCIRLSEGLFFYHKSIFLWAFFRIEILFSDENNPWLKILPNKDAFHHHKVIPARIFFRIRITPSPKSNPNPSILLNQDYSIAEK